MRSKNSIYNVLKHKAFTLCGAAFCAGMLLCTTASCEKQVIRYKVMKEYYKESEKLCWQDDKDSVNRFNKKFHSVHNRHSLRAAHPHLLPHVPSLYDTGDSHQMGAAMGIQECGTEGFDLFAMLRGWTMARG